MTTDVQNHGGSPHERRSSSHEPPSVDTRRRPRDRLTTPLGWPSASKFAYARGHSFDANAILGLDSTLEQATSLAYLAFDATSESAADVGLPIDIGVQPNGQQHVATRRFTNDDLAAIHPEWHAHLRVALDHLPSAWGDLIAAEAHR